MDCNRIRMGRMGYLNVLPIYHALESGMVANDFAFVSGPPAELNARMARGELDVASVSSIEYARRPQDYYLVPDLAIGSRGPVQSVLLLSRVPIETLGGHTVLVSAQTHTSAALLRILFTEYLPLDVRYEVGSATGRLEAGEPPTAMLAIGDEALALRGREDYSHTWDLGEVWRRWTGLPFIFGVWVVRRGFATEQPEAARRACAQLLRAKAWGCARLDDMAALAASRGFLSLAAMRSYFQGLVYDLRDEQVAGLNRFFALLAATGGIARAPEPLFLDMERPAA
ncbi:MAG: menaquinone biosynthetic enzyme MqnA/MqnD family protein [Desulfovibrionaceae bacterium]